MALLGFISSAADYLKEEYDEEDKDVAKIKDINFEKMKKEFEKKLNGTVEEDAKEMLEAGQDAFNSYISDSADIIEEFDDIFSVDFNDIVSNIEKKDDKQDEVDEYAKIIAKNANKPEQVKPVARKKHKEEIDEVFSEIVAHENTKVEEVEEDYVSSLMNDLNDSKIMVDIEKNRKKEEEKKLHTFNTIKKIYPYLADDFIKGIYSLKDSFSNDYGSWKNIVILHRLKFEDLEGLRKFVEVVIQHEYSVNVDEEKMIVDVFKKHENGEGKIIGDICEIANQGKLLTGEYEGYNVLYA